MRKKIKRSLSVKTEYTDPKATAPRDLPQGKPLPSAMFASLAKKQIDRYISIVPKKEIKQDKKESIYAKEVMSMHAPGKPKMKDFEPIKQEKISWWQRIFLRKKKILPQVPIISKPVQIPKPIVKLDEKPAQKQETVKATTADLVEKEQSKETTDAPVHRVSGFDVNLLSQEYSRAFRKTNPVSVLLAYIGLTLVFAGFLFSILYAYQARSEQRISKVEAVKEALKQTIATYNDLENQDSALRAKVDIVGELLKKHVSWNEFLAKLEKETIPEVSYLNMAASLEGEMSISAFAQDYSSLARQITVFQNTAWIKDLSVTSASLVDKTATLPGGVAFDMQITIDKEALYSKQ